MSLAWLLASALECVPAFTSGTVAQDPAMEDAGVMHMLALFRCGPYADMDEAVA